MSTKNPDPVKGIDIPTHAQHIGTDNNGHDHYFSAYDSTVYVVYNGHREYIEEFEDPIVGLAGWVHEIEDRDGWSELHYIDGDFTTFLKEAFR